MSDNGYDIKPDGSKGAVEYNETVNDPMLDAKSREKAERALTWKLDLRLMPMIGLIFIMNYIGRSFCFPELNIFTSNCQIAPP